MMFKLFQNNIYTNQYVLLSKILFSIIFMMGVIVITYLLGRSLKNIKKMILRKFVLSMFCVGHCRGNTNSALTFS